VWLGGWAVGWVLASVCGETGLAANLSLKYAAQTVSQQQSHRYKTAPPQPKNHSAPQTHTHTFKNALFRGDANQAFGYTASSAPALPPPPLPGATPTLTPARWRASVGARGCPWNSNASTEPGPRRQNCSRRAWCFWGFLGRGGGWVGLKG